MTGSERRVPNSFCQMPVWFDERAGKATLRVSTTTGLEPSALNHGYTLFSDSICFLQSTIHPGKRVLVSCDAKTVIDQRLFPSSSLDTQFERQVPVNPWISG